MQTVQVAREAMGTRFEILLEGPDPVELRAVAEEALAEISRLDHRWNRYREDSEVSDLNRRAAREPVRVSQELMEVLLGAQELWKATDGAFDPSLGNLMEHWGFQRNAKGDSATLGELQEALAATGLAHVALRFDEREVRFLRPGLQIDLGAIGKGYALDLAAEVCRRQGVETGLLHAGTSSVIAIGPIARAPWRIGIPTLKTARQGWTAARLRGMPGGAAVLAEVGLKDSALGVSAPWAQIAYRGGRAAGHILDPRTGRPAECVLLAAVLAETAARADALATALVVGGAALQQKLATRSDRWRSLVVVRGREAEGHRVINQGLVPGHGVSELV